MKRYCVTCGVKLIEYKRYFSGFDPGTGKKDFIYDFHCPTNDNKKWWQFNHTEQNPSAQ